MIKATVTLQDTINLLNEMITLDPIATTNLIHQRTPCNASLADHPTIQVDVNRNKQVIAVGLLGVLNGLFGTDQNGQGPIAVAFDLFCPFCGKLDPATNTKDGRFCARCGAEITYKAVQALPTPDYPSQPPKTPYISNTEAVATKSKD